MLRFAAARATIAVSDIERAKAFYGETLGFAAQGELSGGVRYADGRGGWFLVYPSSFAGTARSTSVSFMVDDIESVIRDLRERGIEFEEYDFPGLKTIDGIADIQGERAAWFKDPDGNIISVGQLI
jgi:catechol 2,3-dioxygenase-like lactoylglutathione lyase family enzyme